MCSRLTLSAVVALSVATSPIPALNLRVKDIDFANGGLLVMKAKGDKSRRTLLPLSLHQSLQSQIAFVEHTFEADLAIGKAGV